jgi:type IV secretory pathway TraG/TraD family ATPase VirD4
MSATKVLWGQIIIVFAFVLATMWAATQWVAWRLGYQPELGQPWFETGLWNSRLSTARVLLVVVRL